MKIWLSNICCIYVAICAKFSIVYFEILSHDYEINRLQFYLFSVTIPLKKKVQLWMLEENITGGLGDLTKKSLHII
jgi:hypothetical protein